MSIYPKPNTLLRHVLIFMKLLIVCRSLRDRENGFGMKKEEKAWKVERDKVDHDQAENKKANKDKQQQPQVLHGFFQGGALESEKRG